MFQDTCGFWQNGLLHVRRIAMDRAANVRPGRPHSRNPAQALSRSANILRNLATLGSMITRQ